MSPTNLYLWIGLLLGSIGACTPSLCNLQGDIDVLTDWHGFEPQFIYTAGAQVEFSYNITYSLEDSIHKPIIIILYKEQKPLNFTTDVDCQQKLEQTNYNELANLKISLSLNNFWSGCEDIGEQQLRCVGGRSFVTVTNTTFLIASARCDNPPIKMTHKIGFRGYTGECQGTLVLDPDNSGPFTMNLLIVTIVTVINSAIMLLAIAFLACRKWRLRTATLKLPSS